MPVLQWTLAIVVARCVVAIIVTRRAVALDMQREPISLRPDPKASQAKRAPLPLLCQRCRRARSATRPASCPTSTQAKQSKDGFVAHRPSSLTSSSSSSSSRRAAGDRRPAGRATRTSSRRPVLRCRSASSPAPRRCIHEYSGGCARAAQRGKIVDHPLPSPLPPAVRRRTAQADGSAAQPQRQPSKAITAAPPLPPPPASAQCELTRQRPVLDASQAK